jgi:hypothetical protein
VSELEVGEGELLEKGYRASELIKKTIVIEGVEFITGQNGEYAKCTVSGSGIDADKPFLTGSQNILARLHVANSQNAFPLEAKVVKLGGSNAYDIE